ncbi:acyl transferase domain-containing protein [Alteromonadaceae bacterium 2753L.S.0a.02]|nr:acyl transferase domain-containing protein [Alteromonadaceae bacterium 2753L.S.0a.02]
MDKLHENTADKITLSIVNDIVVKKLKTIFPDLDKAPNHELNTSLGVINRKEIINVLINNFKVPDNSGKGQELPASWSHWVEQLLTCVQQVLLSTQELESQQLQSLNSDLAALMQHDLSNLQLLSVVETYLGERVGNEAEPSIRIAEITQRDNDNIIRADATLQSEICEYRHFNIKTQRSRVDSQETQYGIDTAKIAQSDYAVYDLVLVNASQVHKKRTAEMLALAKQITVPGGMLVFCDWSDNFLGSQLLSLLSGESQHEDSLAPELLHKYGFIGASRLFGDLQGGCRCIWLAQRDAQLLELPSVEVDVAYIEENRQLADATTFSTAELEMFAQERITDCLAKAIAMEPGDLDSTTCFQDYGVDSLVSVKLIKKINNEFETDLKTVDLFDYANIAELARFLAESCREQLSQQLQSTTAVSVVDQPQRIAPVASQKVVVTHRSAADAFEASEPPGLSLNEVADNESSPGIEPCSEAIAVVGMSGCFANSPDAATLWSNLAAGNDLISQASRWDLYEGIPRERHESVCDRGSFLSNIDEFDPQYFNITATEANYMDPQQRIFLQQAWHALEDGGYAGDSLRGASCGVYVGCHSGDYDNLFDERYSPAQSFWGNSGSILPARLAYLLDLKGPALAIDTACSSSLVAIHTAAQALRSGEVNYALAGGVFVQSTAEFYQYANRAGMLSPRGRCHSFDARADGFVPGEGAGVVLLKRLSDALADGDHIHGVIVGSACNQDGATNGITAPSANSQERLERQVYERHGIDAASIQMVEAHGTGTMLGDPIEFQALTRAFRKDTDDRQFCALGSIKSNLGHTATAAGVSGVLKILLAMKHQQIPPSLHFEQGNPNIDFDNSPFFVNTQLRDWPANRDGLPRRAAVSSFGFSGTNVHMVIDQGPECQRVSPKRPGYLVVLSADSEAQLHTLVERLHDHVNATPDIDLGHLSFTLLQGRKHLTQRLAWVVASRDELLTQWQAYLVQRQEAYRGDLKQSPWRGDHSAQHAVQQHLEHASWDNAQTLDALQQLAQAYCSGCPLDTRALFPGEQFARIPLPGYPFARQRYWISDQLREQSAPPATAHPLIHHNHSNFERQQYRSVFQGQEIFLRDHKVRGDAVLPGVAYLEMAREALARSVGSRPGTLVLSDVAWLQPITEAQFGGEITTELARQSDDRLQFSICSGNASVHAQGIAQWQDRHAESVPLEALRARLQTELSGAQCYDTFKRLGIDYGASHRCLETLWCGEGEVLAHLKQSHTTSVDGEYLDPGLLDAALQAALGFQAAELHNAQLAIPRGLREIRILQLPQNSAWVWVREAAQAEDHICVDLDICDDQGQLLLSLQGLELHYLGRGAFEKTAKKAVERASSAQSLLLQYAPFWQTAKLGARRAELLVLCDLPHFEGVLAGLVDECLQLNTGSGDSVWSTASRYHAITNQLVAVLQYQLQQNSDLAVVVIVPPGMEGLIGLLRSVQQEYPVARLQLLCVAAEVEASALQNALEAGMHGDYLRLRGDALESQRWTAIAPQAPEPTWRANGVYLLTGGAGGLGLIFAREIARCCAHPTLVLTGRRTQPDHLEDTLVELAALGASVHYMTLDVSDGAAVQQAAITICERFGSLNGVLHCAGVLNDSLLPDKTAESVTRVLTPKVLGIENLDQATAKQPLDWFIACSSAAAALGNAGQCDYAAANGFMDAAMAQRAEQAACGERSGVSVAINWPLWDEGGMGLSKALREQLWRQAGLAPLPTEQGLQALKSAITAGVPQQLVLFGDTERLQNLLEDTVPSSTAPVDASQSQTSGSATTVDELLNAAVTLVSPVIAKVTGLSLSQLDESTGFDKLGLDSIMMLTITEQLSETFGELSKTLLYENQNIHELAQFLATHFPEKLTGAVNTLSRVKVPEPAVAPISTGGPAQPQGNPVIYTENSAQNLDAIAIVGLAGRYPKARNIEEFWQNLKQGRDCVTPLPQDRWALQSDGQRDLIKNINNTFGGFIDGVDEFDPLFFNINPRDAEFIDPQERLFLQCVYETLEDAGYTKDSLAASCSNDNSRFVPSSVGVYVGVMYEEYQMYGVQSTLQGQPVALGGNPASIANRISYFFDLHGPSMAVDTMCSSSITAIHLACDAIAKGECEAAIAGGVNVSVHPNKYIFLNQGNFTSSDGRCASFGDGGDGYVPGEGVGAVLLKPLHKAEQDGDRIYGVIRGSSLNHGGKTSGYTVPHPNAQAEVIHRAFQRAGVKPEEISYIEAHGTGTSLGDPIEISGLQKVFSGRTSPCAIGSVKSNIGHCESAAGIAGITKILLQMRDKTLVPSLHSETLNRHIDFSKTPFQVQRELTPWHKPQNQKRIAGISSFGAGGSNAHLIIEEYQAAESADVRADNSPGIYLLSAATDEQLQQKAEQLLRHLQSEQGCDLNLQDVAYTLAVGRDSLACRRVIQAKNREELLLALQALASGRANSALQSMEQGIRDEHVKGFGSAAQRQALLDSQLNTGNFSLALQIWLAGLGVDWQALFSAGAYRKIMLPSYPFARERCWFDTPPIATKNLNQSNVIDNSNSRSLTLQMDRITSKSIAINENDFFYRDHVINGGNMLPGAVYLELVRSALAEQVEPLIGSSLHFEDVLWLKPYEAQDLSSDLRVDFEVTAETLSFTVHSERSRQEGIPHCQGHVRLNHGSEQSLTLLPITLDTDSGFTRLSGDTLYRMFAARNFHYGETMRSLVNVDIGDSHALAQLQLPVHDLGEFGLHPALLDAAFQSVIGLLLQENHADNLAAIPVALGSITIFQDCPSQVSVRIARNPMAGGDAAVRLFDMQLVDAQNNICVAISGFAVRLLEMADQIVNSPNLYTPEWQVCDVSQLQSSNSKRYGFLSIGGEQLVRELGTTFSALHPSSWQHAIELNTTETAQDYHTGLASVLGEVRAMLLQDVAVDHLFVVLAPDSASHWQALAALLQSAHWETPGFSGTVVQFQSGDAQAFVQDLTVAANRLVGETALQYRTGQFHVKRWHRKSNSLVKAADYTREAGVYLITGGAGGLGRVLAEHLASTVAEVKLIITGRRSNDQDIDNFIANLETLGCEAEYFTCDVADAAATKQLIYQVTREFGRLDGIYHCAGTKNDAFVIHKTAQEASQVASAKIDGVINLDNATQSLLLDFFVCFSSVAAITGNIGQSDYAFANAFMDSFMGWRANQVASGERYGKSVAINWPLWQGDGMGVSAEVLASLEQAELYPLEQSHGLSALTKVLNGDVTQVAVLPSGFEKLMAMHSPLQRVETTSGQITQAHEAERVLAVIAECCGVSSEDLSETESWQEMGVENYTLNAIAQKLNVTFATTLTAAAVAEQQSPANLLVLIQNSIDGNTSSANNQAQDISINSAPKTELKEGTVMNESYYIDTKNFLIDVLAKELKLPARRISDKEPFERYGIDSISAMRLTAVLEAKYGSLSKTLFFQYTNIASLSKYLTEQFGNQVLDESIDASPQSASELADVSVGPMLQATTKEHETAEQIKPMVTNQQTGKDLGLSHSANSGKTLEKTEAGKLKITEKKSARQAPRQNVTSTAQRPDTDIAIVGIAGRFPKAGNIEDFWELLANGEDCVTEIPGNRWSSDRFFHPNRDNKHTSYSKWGAFLDDVDKFDPKFFNLSPRDAIFMDPQERLFLEVVWELLESAGCTPEQIQNRYSHSIGLYAGAMYQQYRNIQSDPQANAITSVGSYSSMVNRVSHFFDFRGPSVAVDTMCSTAVTCLRMACEDLLRGDTRIAIAGAANLSLHENKYIGLSQGQMLGSHSGSRAFAEGDGYIPAECVGAVMLKRRADAEADGDNILGIIKSIAINHSGRTNAYSVPSLSAQQAVIQSCLQRGGISPDSIDCIESAVNGSALGDPIEMAALNAVFGGQVESQKIALGSVKTNIGHGEAASGVSQLAKVLMQYRHNQLAPSLFIGNENPNLGLNQEIFDLVRNLSSWSTQPAQPRRTLITSFGAGGSNSAMVIEDYPQQRDTNASESLEPQLLLFSARTPERLTELLQLHLEYLGANGGKLNLQTYAYNLQHCRAAMETRLAFCANTMQQVVAQMEAILEHGSIDALRLPRDVYFAQLLDGVSELEHLLSGSIGDMVTEQLINNRELEKLGDLWCKGIFVDWKQLHSQSQPILFSLPKYPFGKERYWLESQYLATSTKPADQKQVEISPVTNDSAGEPDLAEYVRSYIVNFIATELRMDPSEINIDANITRFGVDSITLMRFVRIINEQFGVRVSVKNLSHVTSVREFTDYVCQLDNAEKIAQVNVKGSEQEHCAKIEELLDMALQNYQESETGFDELIEMVDSL